MYRIDKPPQLTVFNNLLSGSVSSVGSLDLNLSDFNYTHILIQLTNWVPATDDIFLECRVSVDGTTFDTDANYSWSGRSFESDGGGTSDGDSDEIF